MGIDWIDKARKQREIDAIPKYGEIYPLIDSRCFLNEALEEGLDLVNYLQWAVEKGEIGEKLFKRLKFDIKRILNIIKLNMTILH